MLKKLILRGASASASSSSSTVPNSVTNAAATAAAATAANNGRMGKMINEEKQSMPSETEGGAAAAIPIKKVEVNKSTNTKRRGLSTSPRKSRAKARQDAVCASATSAADTGNKAWKRSLSSASGEKSKKSPTSSKKSTSSTSTPTPAAAEGLEKLVENSGELSPKSASAAKTLLQSAIPSFPTKAEEEVVVAIKPKRGRKPKTATTPSVEGEIKATTSPRSSKKQSSKVAAKKEEEEEEKVVAAAVVADGEKKKPRRNSKTKKEDVVAAAAVSATNAVEGEEVAKKPKKRASKKVLEEGEEEGEVVKEKKKAATGGKKAQFLGRTEEEQREELIMLQEKLSQRGAPVNVPGVTVVDTPERAQQVANIIMQNADKMLLAVDTEWTGHDISARSLVKTKTGLLLCLSAYAGPEFDFGNGPRLWLDCTVPNVLARFLAVLRSPDVKKVWHNYSADRHILTFAQNSPLRGGGMIKLDGFYADTMHMARLYDSALDKNNNKYYKAAAKKDEIDAMNNATEADVSSASSAANGEGGEVLGGVGSGYSLSSLSSRLLRGGLHKKPMKLVLGQRAKKKDGTEGAIKMPPLEDIHISPDVSVREKWVEYSTLDAECTFALYQFLESHLKKMPANADDSINNSEMPPLETQWDVYEHVLKPFGELLTRMEAVGIPVDVPYLLAQGEAAAADADVEREKFFQWVKDRFPAFADMNLNSSKQKAAFLFGKEGLGLTPEILTANDQPSTSSKVISSLISKPVESSQVYKKLSHAMGHEEALKACNALLALQESERIETLRSSFLTPLPLHIIEGRVHASVNVNTETGRLSARVPNMQNMPALDKDRYKIRKAFKCKEGNAIIAADYGQLELRVLAHVTKCKSMIEAFELGGDFHSRTAMGMYSHVQQAIDEGKVLLEWNGEGKPPLPLLKDVFGAERRRAKALNFSIAYGKTAKGLASELGQKVGDAQGTLEKWYALRPEVKDWQNTTRKAAVLNKYVTTLLGRRRNLPMIKDKAMSIRNHCMRAAINTPIQGSAADIVMLAMLAIDTDELIRSRGWVMMMQIHDEILLEGPQEHAEEVQQRLIQLMQNPMGVKLLVELIVDSHIASNWYEAK